MKRTAMMCCALVLCVSACSRQQSDWQKARDANTTDSYELYLKKYPSGEFTAQAQARVKELYEERDWQKARDVDTPEAYQAFMKQYPEGKWTEEARIRVENFTLAQAPAGSSVPAAGTVASAPAPAPAVAPAAPAAKPVGTAPRMAAAAVANTRGRYGVQLGAYKSGATAAERRWVHLQKQYPKLLSGLTSKVVAKKTSQGSVYRLQALGMTEQRARAVCDGLRAKAQPCVLVKPENS